MVKFIIVISCNSHNTQVSAVAYIFAIVIALVVGEFFPIPSIKNWFAIKILLKKKHEEK